MHAVDRDVAEARLGAADLDILSIAFVALEGNTGHAADGIRNIGVWKAGDHFRGKYLHDIVCGNFTIERFDFTVFALSANNDLLTNGLDLQFSGNVLCATGSDIDFFGEILKTDVGNRERVLTGVEICDCELPL